MLDPTDSLEHRCGVPREVIREAYQDNPEWRAELAESVRKIRDLMVELGAIGPVSRRLWKALGVWSPQPPRRSGMSAAA